MLLKPVPATVDSRIRFQATAPVDFIDELKRACTHRNPKFYKMQSMGYATWSTPREIETWRLDPCGGLSLPRGVTQMVRATAAKHGLRAVFADNRLVLPAVEWPQLNATPRDYQQLACDTAMRIENGLIKAPTACLAGDTVIGVNRAGKSFNISISELVRRQNGARVGGKVWDPGIQTMIRVRDSEGYIRLHKLAAAVVAGPKPTYVVRTESGHEIRATADHQFLTTRGWKRLGDIRRGNAVYVDAGLIQRTSKKPRPNYKVVNGLRQHPHAGRRGVRSDKGGWSTPKHRLVFEAAMNDIQYDEFVALLRSKSPLTRPLVFLGSEKWEVHHLDHDPTNNALENLAVLSRSDHKLEHARSGGWKHVTASTKPVRIVSIRKHACESTYDLSMQGEPHNFIANGFVVHNSGKTTMAFMIAAAARQPALVMCRDANLLQQWKERACEKEFRFHPSEIGILKGSKLTVGKHLTLALQQTLGSKRFPLKDAAKMFGTVFLDEAQNASCNTAQHVIDAFPARYRIGISADHTRKDKMEFLTYEQFGTTICDISRHELEQRRLVHAVEVRLVPTRFTANWYRDSEPGARDFNRLVDEVTACPDRNAVLVALVRELVATRAVPCVVFSHRTAHVKAMVYEDFHDAGIDAGLLLGTDEYRARFELAKQRLVAGTLDVAMGTLNAMGVGIDIPNIASGIVSTPLGNNAQYFGQIRGRIARIAPGKTSAVLYVLWDRYVTPELPRNVAKWNDGNVSIRDEKTNEWTRWTP